MPLWFFFMQIAIGLIAAAVAQSVLRDLSVSDTIVFGLLGAFLAGLSAWLFVNAGFGVFFSAVGAGALLYVRNRFVEYRYRYEY